MSIIVFTDLDGTFLDHHSYQYDAALPAVGRLKAMGARIVPVTSKTIVEIEDLKLPFGDVPQIAENGMVTKQADGRFVIAQDYASILRFIDNLPDDLRCLIRGFHDMSVSEVAQHTSLPENKAQMAMARQGSEPFLWSGHDAQMAILKERAGEHNLSITQGGRFYHIMGPGGKAQAVQSFLQDDMISIALGDGPNDAEMLACADYGVQIPNQHGAVFEVPDSATRLVRPKGSGPVGWNEAIHHILDHLL